MSSTVDDPLFAPPADAWNRLPTSYVPVRRIQALAWCLAWWVPLGIVSWFVFRLPWVTAVVAGVGVAWTLWRLLRAKRWAESWGWAERGSDLVFTHGLWTRTLTVVPYGRLQVVEVTAGPLLRWKKLAKVQLVTASVQATAAIPGLTHADAIALRDRMIALSDARGSGL